jgi:hypothetical protein
VVPIVYWMLYQNVPGHGVEIPRERESSRCSLTCTLGRNPTWRL